MIETDCRTPKEEEYAEHVIAGSHPGFSLAQVVTRRRSTVYGSAHAVLGRRCVNLDSLPESVPFGTNLEILTLLGINPEEVR